MRRLFFFCYCSVILIKIVVIVRADTKVYVKKKILHSELRNIPAGGGGWGGSNTPYI